VLVNLGKTYFTSALPSLWLFALGAMFIFVTLFMPRGIMGLVRRRKPTDVTEPNLARAAAREVTG
jgi:urea transport system permease protein